jgi:hypothetical protein
MSRISNQSFKVNSALEQIVEISNTSAIPVSEDADIVKWGGVATSLGSKLSAASVPVVLASDQAAVPISTASTLDVDLDSVSGSAITLGQKVKASSLPVVLASDGAITSGADTTLSAVQQNGIYGWDGSAWRQVQVSATGVLKTESELETHSGTQGNLDNGSVVVGGDTSTSISTTNKTLISIFGNHSVASAELEVQVSADGTNFYPNGYSIFANSNGDFYTLFEGCANNIRLKYTTAGTVTATLLANSH